MSLPRTTTMASTLLFLFLFSSVAAKHGYSTAPLNDAAAPPPNPKLQQAYIALQAWKRVIRSDPRNFTSNWNGPDVCTYTGVFCAPAPYDQTLQVVAGIDFNQANLLGILPNELCLLSDLTLIHLHSNRFAGALPSSLPQLTLLYELDLGNNLFAGSFPDVVLSLPSLRYLDLRFNQFQGPVPPQLFTKGLDAIFLNDNKFTGNIDFPTGNLNGISSPSVIVFANNNLNGCLPPTIAKFADALEELLFINTGLSGCLPPEFGNLGEIRVLDVSYNNLTGPIPNRIAELARMEILNLRNNKLSGAIPEGICALPNLRSLMISYNFFNKDPKTCRNLRSKGVEYDDVWNCFPDKGMQRGGNECVEVLRHPVNCLLVPCGNGPLFSNAKFVTTKKV